MGDSYKLKQNNYKESRSHPAMVILQLSESMLMGQQVNTFDQVSTMIKSLKYVVLTVTHVIVLGMGGSKIKTAAVSAIKCQVCCTRNTCSYSTAVNKIQNSYVFL